MSESRRVLAIDEQRATLDFLRSVLPLIEGESFEIQRVLSAEEGLLELRRKPYDLLITGFRLPGMDGLELSRRAKSLRPYLPIVLVSEQPLPEIREMVGASNVDYLMRKPLDAEEFLDAVQESLVNAPPAMTRAAKSEVAASASALPSAIVRRLETLCEETGADQVLLATVSGEILHATGGQLHRDIPRLVAAAAASVSRGLDLSRQLDESEPRAVQFVQGKSSDLYWANVGFEYFIAILFNAQVRRGRIGTVWVFTQRAVNELKERIGDLPVEPPTGQSALEPVTAGQADAAAEPLTEDALGPAEEMTAILEAPEILDEADFPEDDEPQQLERSPAEQALDAFWEEAVAFDSGGDEFGGGLSLEEAKAKGIVGEDFDPDELLSGSDD